MMRLLIALLAAGILAMATVGCGTAPEDKPGFNKEAINPSKAAPPTVPAKTSGGPTK